MNQKRSRGFSLLEVLLAVVVVLVAGLGAYSLFNSGISQNNISDATEEAVQIANVYTDLASSGLTNNVASEGIETLLQNSGRLSNKYFSSSTPPQMLNPYGALIFSSATPYSYQLVVPLGCSTGDVASLSSVPGQLFSKVKDIYSCDATGSKDYAVCVGSVTGCTGGTKSTITLYFNMNN
jgi:prepilin-type N-terminal cleavage/methylation domain-containing protein